MIILSVFGCDALRIYVYIYIMEIEIGYVYSVHADMNISIRRGQHGSLHEILHIIFQQYLGNIFRKKEDKKTKQNKKKQKKTKQCIFLNK